MAKIQVSLDDELLKRIDSYADDNYMSRSGLITLATTQFLNANEVTKAIVSLNTTMQKIAETGSLDHETMEQLEDWQRLANLLTTKK